MGNDGGGGGGGGGGGAGTPLINRLVEEAIELLNELVKRADAVAEEAAEIQEGAGTLATLAEQADEDVHREMLEALHAVEHAQHEVDTRGDAAAGVLDDLPARGDDSEKALKGLVDGIHEDMTQLSDLRGRLRIDVDGSREMVDLEFQQLSERVQSFQERLDAGLQRAAEEVERLSEVIGESRTQLTEKQGALRDAIGSLPLLAADRAEALAANLHALMVLLGRNVFAVCERVQQLHNDMFATLRTGFTGEPPGASAPAESWVSASAVPLLLALDDLGAVPEAAETVLGEWPGAIVDNANAAVMHLGEIAASLEGAVPDTAATAGA